MAGEDEEYGERIWDTEEKVTEIKRISIEPLHAGNGQREKCDYEEGGVKKELSQTHDVFNTVQ